MTIEQLIKELKNYPHNAEVRVAYETHDIMHSVYALPLDVTNELCRVGEDENGNQYLKIMDHDHEQDEDETYREVVVIR